ncbi:MAG: lipopolysaccharide heptosyltransferase II [Candidatus Omnitrophota bacterium]
MKILHILPELNLGGVETATFDTVKYMLREGHSIVVVSNGGILLKDLEALGAKHYKLPVHKKAVFTIFKMVSKLAGIIKKENIDIVHAHSRVPAWIAYFACRRTGTVFITTCHGYYRSPIFSQVMGWGKRVIAISNCLARHMVDDFGVPYERIKLIPSGVDLEKFKRVESVNKKGAEFNIGMVGRLTRIKGHLDFIKAMAKVARVIPNIKIWIVGDAGPQAESYKEEIEVLVKRLGIKHCTEFLGNQRDIPAVMSDLDVLVLATTVPEAFGRVIIEAQSCMVPVVATRVGGVVDIIEDNKTGLLVPPSDPQSMSEAVIKILNDKEFARGLAELAHKKVVEKFSAPFMVSATLEVYKEALEARKILIIKFSSLGDIILSSPAIKAIRDKFSKNYEISFLVGEESKEALLNCPYIDELMVCDLKNKDKGISGLLKLGRRLRKKNFDMVIDLQNNRKSHILAFLSRSLNRLGYHNGKFSFLLNYRIKNNQKQMNPVPHQFRILEMLDIKFNEQGLALWPTQEDQNYVDELLSGQWLAAGQKIVGINISSSPRWLTKNWPLENMVKLCDKLGAKDVRVVITGTDKDLDLANALIARAKQAKIINFCGKTSVNQLAALIKKCSVYISTDSAPLHIAAAMGAPFVALFGPTDPVRHIPPANNYVVIRKELKCEPCYKSKCKDAKCMNSITPEEVMDAVGKLLKC